MNCKIGPRARATPDSTGCDTWLAGVVLDAAAAEMGAKITSRQHLVNLCATKAKVSR